MAVLNLRDQSYSMVSELTEGGRCGEQVVPQDTGWWQGVGVGEPPD